jgi:hypothetical protein
VFAEFYAILRGVFVKIIHNNGEKKVGVCDFKSPKLFFTKGMDK